MKKEILQEIFRVQQLMGVENKKPLIREQLTVLLNLIKTAGANMDDLIKVVVKGVESGSEVEVSKIDDLIEYVKSTGKYTDEEIETLSLFLKKSSTMEHISTGKGLFSKIDDLADDITEQEANVLAKLAKSTDLDIEGMIKKALNKLTGNISDSPTLNFIETSTVKKLDEILESPTEYIENIDDLYKILDDKIDERFPIPENASDVQKELYGKWRAELKTKIRENANINSKIKELNDAGKIRPNQVDDVVDDVVDDSTNPSADTDLANTVRGRTGIIEDLLYGRLANYVEGLFVLLKGSFGNGAIVLVERRIDDIVRRIEENFTTARNGEGFADDGLPNDPTLRKNIDTLKSKLQVEMKVIGGTDSAMNQRWNQDLDTFTTNTSSRLQADLDVRVRSIQNNVDLSDAQKSTAINELRTQTNETISLLNQFKSGIGRTASRQTIKELVERASQSPNISKNILIDIRNGLARVGGIRATFKTYFDSGFSAWMREIMDAPNWFSPFVKSDGALGFKIVKPKLAIILRPVINEILFGMITSPIKILKKITNGGRIKTPNGYMSVPLSYFCRFLWQTLTVQIFSAVFEAVSQQTFNLFGAGLERAQKDTTGYIVWDLVHNDDGFFDTFYKSFEWNPYFQLIPDSLAKSWGLSGVNDFTKAMGFNATLGQRFYDYIYEAKNEDAMEVNLQAANDDLEKMFDDIEENPKEIQKVSQEEIDKYKKLISQQSRNLVKNSPYLKMDYIEPNKAQKIIENIKTVEGLSPSFRQSAHNQVEELIKSKASKESVATLVSALGKPSDKNFVSDVVVKAKDKTYKLVTADNGYIRYQTPDYDTMNTPPYNYKVEEHKLKDLDI